jgi:hypothetical protein
MKKRPPRYSVKALLASLQKPIHISDKKGLQVQAAAITEEAIKRAQRHRYPDWTTGDPLKLNSVTSAQIDTFLSFLERPRSEKILRARAAAITGHIISDLQYHRRRPKE